MSVKVAPGSVPVLDQAGDLTTFPDPPVGQDFQTSVPTGVRWRIHGASCRVVTGAAGGNRTPAFFAGIGSIPIYSASNNQVFTSVQTRKAVFYDQELYYAQVFYSTWVPIGQRAIWLPEDAIVRLGLTGIQAGDQISQVGLLLETEGTL